MLLRTFVIASTLVASTSFASSGVAPIDLKELRNPQALEPIHDPAHYSSRMKANALAEFSNPTERPAGFDVTHYNLDLQVDPAAGVASGVATLSITTTRDQLSTVVLDAVDMEINAVSDPLLGNLEFFYDQELLTIMLPNPVERGTILHLDIGYRATQAQYLRATGPDVTHPNRSVASYTYTQPLGSRYWFPCLDRPSDKATINMQLTVPDSYVAIGNGIPQFVSKTPQGTVFAYRMEEPVAPYLVSLNIGQYDRIDLGEFRGKPLILFTPNDLIPQALTETGDTIGMMESFTNFTGFEYPFPLYTTTVAQAWGSSMEHQTVTSMGGMRITGDTSGTSTVAHELAHQWFGDYVTCESWEELWLNEGFASYLPMVYYVDKDQALNAHGSFEWWRDGYFSEAQTMVRALSARTIDPDLIFDSHSYEKGAMVINLMRHIANKMPAINGQPGEETFTTALRIYLQNAPYGNVRNFDLQRALETATGKSWDLFFTQWVRSPGHPVLGAEWRHNGRELVVKISQQQALRADRQWRSFRFPLEIEVIYADGETSRHEVDIYSELQSIPLPVSRTDVSAIHLNPRWTVPMEFEINQPAESWQAVIASSEFRKSKLAAMRTYIHRLGETKIDTATLGIIINDRDSYILADAVERLSVNEANGSAVQALHTELVRRADDHRYIRGAVRAAEKWLRAIGTWVTQPGDLAALQAAHGQAPTQYERALILDMMLEIDAEATHRFAMDRLAETGWSTRDRYALVKTVTTKPTVASADLIGSAMTNMTPYFRRLALRTLSQNEYDVGAERIDELIGIVQDERYFMVRNAALDLLAVQVNHKEEVCRYLNAVLARPTRTMPGFSRETSGWFVDNIEAAAGKLSCQ